jgi:hypothetical protein
MARTIDDVLEERVLLDARAAVASCEKVAQIRN